MQLDPSHLEKVIEGVPLELFTTRLVQWHQLDLLAITIQLVEPCTSVCMDTARHHTLLPVTRTPPTQSPHCKGLPLPAATQLPHLLGINLGYVPVCSQIIETTIDLPVT